MKILKEAGMKTWEHLKINYFNNKAQTITELASFGSLLLVVVSFLVSYGLRYNYQQDVQLRAFRMAMADAYNNVTRPEATSTITLVEDKHIPDPRDRFGVGSVVPAQGRAQIVWGNTMNDPYVDTSDNSQIKYVINGEERAYTTEGFEIIDSSNAPGGFYVDFLDERRLVSWDTVTCYWPGNDTNTQKLVRIPVGEYKWELISSIYLRDSGGNAVEQNLPIISVVPSGAKNGDPITGFGVKSPRRGEINPYYAQQLNQDTGENNGATPQLVTPENMQGLLLTTDTKNTRSGSLRLRETSSQWSSTESFNMNADITRKIRKNGGEDTITSAITTSVSGRTMTSPK